VGPALTALFLLLGPATLVLAANAVTFLVSAALLTSIRVDRGAPSAADAETEDEPVSLWASTLEGARSAGRLPGVAVLLVIGTVSILAAGLMNVAEPLLATGPLHAGNSGYSLLVAVYGAAMTAGSLVTSSAGSSVSRLRAWLVLGLAAQGVGMIGSATAPNLGWASASFALTGVGNALFLGPELRLLQELVGERLLGRVFGLRDMVANLAYVLAFLSAGAVLALLGVRAVFALGGVALIALTGAGCLGLRPHRAANAPPVAAEPA
jgi:MFS family permease